MPSFYEQAIGGAEYQSYLLSEAAKSMGMEVYYIFIDNGAPCPNNLNLHLIPIRSLRIRQRFGATDSLYYRPVMNALRAIDPDVVYVRGGSSFSGMAAYFATAKSATSHDYGHVSTATGVGVAF